MYITSLSSRGRCSKLLVCDAEMYENECGLGVFLAEVVFPISSFGELTILELFVNSVEVE